MVQGWVQAGKVSPEEVQDTFGNARMPTLVEQELRRKPEVYQAIVNRTEAGYRAFLEGLGLHEGFAKARVRAHARRTPSGGVAQVRAYIDKRTKKPEKQGSLTGLSASERAAIAGRAQAHWEKLRTRKGPAKRAAYLEKVWESDPDAVIALVVGNEPDEAIEHAIDLGQHYWKKHKNVPELLARLNFMFWQPSRKTRTPPTMQNIFDPLRIGRAMTLDWQDSSRSLGAHLLGRAAAREHGVEWVFPTPLREQTNAELAKTLVASKSRFVEQVHVVARRMRAEARRRLAGNGKEKMLYRGVRSIHTRACTLESWTPDPGIARDFDGAGLLRRAVATAAVLTWHGSAYWGGNGDELEYVLLGEKAA